MFALFAVIAFFAIFASTSIGAMWCWRHRRFNGESLLLRWLALRDAAIGWLFLSALVAGRLDTLPRPPHSAAYGVVMFQALVVLFVASLVWIAFLIKGKQ